MEKNKMVRQYEEDIHIHIIKLVAEMKTELQDHVIEIKFNEKWIEWIEALKSKITNIPYHDNEDIDGIIENTLRNRFKMEHATLSERLKNQPLKVRRNENSFEIDFHRHISMASYSKAEDIQLGPRVSPQHMITLANEETVNWEEDVKKVLISKLNMSKTFNSGMIESLLSHLQSFIGDFNDTSTIFSFTLLYKIDFAVYVSNIASRTVKEWLKQYRIVNDPIFSLEKLKPKYLKVFINKYNKVTTELAAANQLCNSLIKTIGNAVSKCLHLKIINEMMRINKMLRSKLRFKVLVLSDLAKFNKFKLYATYIKNNDSSLKSWASYYVEQYCYKSAEISDDFKQLAKEEIKVCTELICAAADKQNYCNVEEWLDQFCALLDGKVEINKEEWMKDIKEVDNNVSSINNFIKHLLLELNEVGVAESAYEDVIINYNEICEKASDKLYRDLTANTCNAQCPFCDETCEVLKNNHLLTFR